MLLDRRQIANSRFEKLPLWNRDWPVITSADRASSSIARWAKVRHRPPRGSSAGAGTSRAGSYCRIGGGKSTNISGSARRSGLRHQGSRPGLQQHTSLRRLRPCRSPAVRAGRGFWLPLLGSSKRHPRNVRSRVARDRQARNTRMASEAPRYAPDAGWMHRAQGVQESLCTTRFKRTGRACASS